MNSRRKLLTFLLLTLTQIGCDEVPSRTTGPMLVDLDGNRLDALAPGGADGVALIFIGRDCPIARRYSPELVAIARDYDRIALRLILIDRDLSAANARLHADDFSLPRPVLLDPDHRLAQRLGATITPEAFLIDARGSLVYAGRIDDSFAELGVARPAPRTRDLRDAIEAVLRGKTPALTRTRAVGCLIE